MTYFQIVSFPTQDNFKDFDFLGVLIFMFGRA